MANSGNRPRWELIDTSSKAKATRICSERRSEFAIVTSERCLLTMRLPARELRTSLAPNLHTTLRGLLERLRVPEEQVNRELDAMQAVSFARATKRRVPGSMSDLAFQASHHLTQAVIRLRLRSALLTPPCPRSAKGRGDPGFPDRLARALLAAGVA